jgi:glucosylceramidase
MLRQSTRRQFLKSSAVGVVTAAAAGALPLVGEEGAANAEIRAWVTSDEHRFAPLSPPHWRTAVTPSSQAIVLQPQQKYQPIRGFGAAFTEAACYMFSQLPAPDREHLFHELFHPSEMRLSVCRTCIGSSDYSTLAYTYDEGEPDPELKRFSIEHDRQHVIPMLREARRMNPDLFLFSSPWSPPGWMKSGGSMLGGSMRKRYIPVYAEYFVKFLQAYAGEGVAIQAVTPQNEVDTDQDARMPACIWPQEYETEFVQTLGPLLEKNGMDTKIWILDHNYNLWGRAVAELDDPILRKYCNAIAWHGYVGRPEMMSQAHEAHPDAAMYWTEGGPDYTSPDYLTDWAKWGKTFTGILRNWCRSILSEHPKAAIQEHLKSGHTFRRDVHDIDSSGRVSSLSRHGECLEGRKETTNHSLGTTGMVSAKDPRDHASASRDHQRLSERRGCGNMAAGKMEARR